MTLCLAAQCKTVSGYAMVVATDYESENEMVGAEIQSKITQIDGGYYFLSAGTHTRAEELIEVCDGLISRRVQESFYDLLRKAVTVQKKRLADEYVSGQLGITYDEFVSSGKEKLPEEIHRDMTASIRLITLGCSLLAIDFSASDPKMFRIHETGMIEMCDNFAAVGTGMFIAESMLFLRSHSGQDALRITLFEVFEAMLAGQRAPGVGDTFTLVVLSRKDGKIRPQNPTDAYAQYMLKMVDKYSIRSPYKYLKAPAMRIMKPSDSTHWGIRVKTKETQSVSQKSKNQQ